jgi:hypothetical protein
LSTPKSRCARQWEAENRESSSSAAQRIIS